MSLRAVSFCFAKRAACFASYANSESRGQPAKSIFTRLDRLKMIGVHATSGAAKVIYLESVWNLSLECLVGIAVGRTSVARQAHCSVALTVQRAKPQPTTRRGFLRGHLLNLFSDRYEVFSHGYHFTPNYGGTA